MDGFRCECNEYGDYYYVDDDGKFVCMCGESVVDEPHLEDGHWVGDD